MYYQEGWNTNPTSLKMMKWIWWIAGIFLVVFPVLCWLGGAFDEEVLTPEEQFAVDNRAFEYRVFEKPKIDKEKPEIYGIHSPLSVFSFFSIFIWIFCLIPYGKGFLAGFGTNCVYFTIVVIFMVLLNVNEGRDRPDFLRFRNCANGSVFKEDIKTTIDQANPALQYSVSGTSKFTEINGEKQGYRIGSIYAMHCKDYKGFRVSPWVFHPAAFFWIPGILGALIPVLGGLAICNRNG